MAVQSGLSGSIFAAVLERLLSPWEWQKISRKRFEDARNGFAWD
jgi:hypothetical protein